MPLLSPPRPDLDTQRRQLAEILIHSLERYIPDVAQAAICILEAGGSPESAISELGHSLATLLSRFNTLQSRLEMADLRINWLLQENDRLHKDPLRSELAEEKAQTAELAKRLAAAKAELDSARLALAKCQGEVADRQAYILSQNRIIAQQQLRLNTLLGETPSAETPGEP